MFPRIDPCVITLIQNADGSAILLGENARRPGYFSCVAGYIGVGETAEEALAREVWEETGRRVSDIVYAGSQPWPQSGSLMLAFTCRTHDTEPQAPTDGELVRTVWATREDLETLPLAQEGSIARELIARWTAGEFEGEARGN